MTDNIDKKIINSLCNGFSLVSRPFKAISKELDITEKEVINRVLVMKADGRLRRIGVALKHTELGYICNIMVVWSIEDENMKNAQEFIIQLKEVSHCYERETTPNWDYNLYTMIHGKSKEEVVEVINKIAKNVSYLKYKMLFTTGELKKTGVKYFREMKYE